jgi:hypothetical protein
MIYGLTGEWLSEKRASLIVAKWDAHANMKQSSTTRTGFAFSVVSTLLLGMLFDTQA